MKKKVCCVFNYAPHYRIAIYKLMANLMSVDFYFCDKLPKASGIKKISYSDLPNVKKELNHRNIRSWTYWSGLLKLVFCSYNVFIITPQYRNISQWLFLIICRITRKRVIAWWHGIAPGYKGSGREWYIQKKFFSLFSANLIYGDKAREYMKEIEYPATNTVTIYNSLDYDAAVKLRKSISDKDLYKIHFNNELPTLVFIGRLTKVKRLDMLLTSHRILNEKGIGCNLVIIGEGSEKNTLEGLASDDLQSRIWFAGAIYDEQQIAKMLYNADVCVSPGNVGLTAIHALYYGLPTITNDNYMTQMPEHECIISGYSGDFFVDGSIDSLTETIANWLQHSKGREVVREMCYRIAADKFNPYKQIEIIQELVERI